MIWKEIGGGTVFGRRKRWKEQQAARLADMERRHAEAERAKRELRESPEEHVELLTEFRSKLVMGASIRDGEHMEHTFMSEALERLPSHQLDDEWEEWVEQLRQLFNRRAIAHTLAGPDANASDLEETRMIREVGDKICQAGGGWLMVLIAHRAFALHRLSVRQLEYAWDGIGGWAR